MVGKSVKYLIIGGGFFGSYLAYLLNKRNKNDSILVIEREKELIMRASYNNQARIHHGYHYPRSFLTAFSSNKNFEVFVNEFRDCVVDDFEKYYAVGRYQSKVTASQYKVFVERIGAPIDPAPSHIKQLFNMNFVEDVFLCKEHAFDAMKLREIMQKKLDDNRIPVLFRNEAVKVKQINGDNPDLVLETEILDLKTKKKSTIKSKYVFICTYANINMILNNSGIEKIDLKQELTEMPMIQIPPEIDGKAITIMCGPFFSIMPFPPEGVYCIHHVRYTPHFYWYDRKEKLDNQKHYEMALKKVKTNFPKIIKDVSRYIPSMAKAKYLGSIWEIKTILPRNEHDDGRPILIKKDVGNFKNLICIMGGKLDNVYDIEDRLGELN